MKKKKLVLLVVMMTLIFFSASMLYQKVQAEFNIADEIKAEYQIGDIVELPEGTVEIGGKSYLAKSIVILPNGVKQSTKSLKIEMEGTYKVFYEKQVGGETYASDIKEFNVYKEKYSVNNLSASVSYVENHPLKKNGEATGLNVELFENATFTYFELINFNELSADVPLFKFYTWGENVDDVIFKTLTVRFIDAYDENNYLDFILYKDVADKVSGCPVYMRVAVGNQPSAGKNRWGDNIYKNNGGTTVSVDYRQSVERPWEVYLNPMTLDVSSILSDGGTTFVANLADENYFNEGWTGFTDGKCYMKVFAKDYLTIGGGVLIEEILGKTLNDFKVNKIIDEDAPKLFVVNKGYENDNFPFAVCGYPYGVFAVEAVDIYSGVNEIETKVFFEYYTEKRKNISIQNGTFIPRYSGIYTIEYKVTDYFGNQAVETINVNAVLENDKPLSISIEENQEILYSTTGNYVSLPDYYTQNVSGEAIVSMELAFKGKKQIINTAEKGFRPMEAGEYTVTYNLVDYTGRKAYAVVKINVVNGADPIFLNEVNVPKYFLVGYEQRLPELCAYDFYGGKDIIPTITVKADGLQDKILTDGKFIPDKLYENKTLFFVYTANSSSGKTSRTYTAQCVNIYQEDSDSKIDKRKLFDVITGTVEKNFTSLGQVNYASYTFDGDGTIQYINPLPLQDFYISFLLGNGDFERVKIKLINIENENEYLELVFRNENNTVKFSMDEKKEYLLDKYSFDEANTNPIAFSIDWFGQLLSFSNENNLYDLRGDNYFGIESGKVYLEISVEGIEEQATLSVQKIGNQTLTDSTRDNASVIVIPEKDYKKNYGINTVLKIAKLICLDAINPYSQVTLTVINPKGQVIFGTNGKLLENINPDGNEEILLNEYGTYILDYLVNGVSVTYLINVMDFTPPIVSITEIKTSYKVGDSVTLNASANDDISGNCQVYITVKNVKGKHEIVSVGEQYTFRTAGKYAVTAYAYDELGNYGFKTYLINVED